jgi:monoamine oxidase
MAIDYIIVGGGLAGLHTGITLLQKHPDASVTLFEKYGYIGGRVVTYRHTVPGFGNVQWENGAGRIHKEKHPLVMKYIKRYGLTVTPIGDAIYYYDRDLGALRTTLFESSYLPMIQDILSHVDPLLLRTHTIKELLVQLIGIKKTEDLLDEFAYDAEVETLRADWALHGFKEEMGTHAKYVSCVNGLDSLIKGMVREFKKAGGILQLKTPVKHIHKETLAIETHDGTRIKAQKAIILALHHQALCELGGIRGCAILRNVTMRPLLRTYAVFKDGDLSGIPRFVTKNGLRYFIPMNGDGTLAMISYTDGNHAEQYMKRLRGGGRGDDALCAMILRDLRSMFPDRVIADPIFFKAHPWNAGCSYWVPGDYDIQKASVEAHTPFGPHIPIYICGESFSMRQAWMEGALEHAESLFSILQ